MNKKRILTVMTAVMMLSALTACGGDSSQADEAGSSQTAVNLQEAETTPAAETAEAETPEAETSAAEAEADPEAPAEDAAAGAAIDFDFNANGTVIVCGDEAQPVLDALGTADSTFEAPSCAFTGTSYYYTYGGMQVVTYPDEFDQSLNRIYEVDLNDDTVATNEGIKVGDTYDDVIAKYGTPDQESPAFLVYKTEGKAVQFFLEGNNIKTIVYTVTIG